MANLAHAVEFGRPLAIFTERNISFSIYARAFGAVLPLVSLIFARVLSNVVVTEGKEDAAFTEAKIIIAGLRRQLRESEAQKKTTEDAPQSYRSHVRIHWRLAPKLVSDDKRERIIVSLATFSNTHIRRLLRKLRVLELIE